MAFNDIYAISGSGMQAQTVRLNAVASNMANAGSVAGSEQEAYKALKPVFASLFSRMEAEPGQARGHVAGAKVHVTDVVQSQAPAERSYEPGHPMADDDGYIYYGNVNVVEEMADMMSASRSFQTSVDVISRASSMQQSLLRLGQQG